MKRILVFIFLFAGGLFAYGQNVDDSLAVENGKPKVNVKVNKVYDENGNLIEYDSTYEWSYSYSSPGLKIDINPDSLFRAFVPWFNEQLDINSLPSPKDFFSDTTMYNDFFNNNDFFDQWQNELFNFNEEIQQLDSLKRLFFKEYLEQNKNNDKEIKKL